MTPEQFRRFGEMALWLIQNPGIEESLCAECFDTHGEDQLCILRELRERGYYEFLLLFIMRSQYTHEGGRALERLCLSLLLKEADRVGMEKLLADYEALLTEEVCQSRAGG